MNRKIAKLLTNNITNDRVVTEMIMYICNKECNVENHLIDLCLATDAQLVTKEMIMEHIDKIKSLCMKYMDTIQEVSNVKIIYVDNITSQVMVGFKAKVIGWYHDQESANRGHSWDASTKETNEYKVKSIYTNTYSIHIPFRDIDIDIDVDVD